MTFRYVSSHPKKPYLSTSDNHSMRVWDLRYLSDRSGSFLKLEGSSPRSGKFSFVTGEKLLAACMDGNVRIFGTANLFLENTQPDLKLKVADKIEDDNRYNGSYSFPGCDF